MEIALLLIHKDVRLVDLPSMLSLSSSMLSLYWFCRFHCIAKIFKCIRVFNTYLFNFYRFIEYLMRWCEKSGMQPDTEPRRIESAVAKQQVARYPLRCEFYGFLRLDQGAMRKYCLMFHIIRYLNCKVWSRSKFSRYIIMYLPWI